MLGDGPSAFFESGAPLVPAGPKYSPHRRSAGDEPVRVGVRDDHPSLLATTVRSDQARRLVPPSPQPHQAGRERPAAAPRWSQPQRQRRQTPTPQAPQVGFRFPAVRSVLWDATEHGAKVFIGAEDALPDVTIPGAVLADIPPLLEPGTPPPTGVLVAAPPSLQRQAHAVVVQRYEPDRQAPLREEGQTCLDLLRRGVGGSDSDEAVGQQAQQHEERELHASLRERGATAVERLLQPKIVASLVAGPEGAAGQLKLRVCAEVLAPAVTMLATPIRNLRILPTPLATSLAAAQPVGGSGAHSSSSSSRPAHAADMRAGFLTIDACRRCIPMHVSDPKVYEWPLVGVWVSDVNNIYDSLVWAACLRFCQCESVSERVAQDGAFLLLLYTRGQHAPHMYEWRLTPSVNLGRATNFPLQLFTSALELPLSALHSDRDAAPFQFLFRQKDAGHAARIAAPTAPLPRPAAATNADQPAFAMQCPQPSPPPTPLRQQLREQATAAIAAPTATATPAPGPAPSSSAPAPPAWSPMLRQPEAAAAAAAAAAVPEQNVMLAQQLEQQQSQLSKLQDMVLQLQSQLAAVGNVANPAQNHPIPQQPSDAANTCTATTSTGTSLISPQGKTHCTVSTNTSLIWSGDGGGVIPTANGSDNDDDAAGTEPCVEAELRKLAAWSRFGTLQQDDDDVDNDEDGGHEPAKPSGAEDDCGDGDDNRLVGASPSTGPGRAGSDPSADDANSPAQRASCSAQRTPVQPARSARQVAPSPEHMIPATPMAAGTSQPHAASRSSGTPLPKSPPLSSTDSSGGQQGHAATVAAAAEEEEPSTPNREWELQSVAATPPSPPQPLWRAATLHCTSLNVSGIEVPRVKVPLSMVTSSGRKQQQQAHGDGTRGAGIALLGDDPEADGEEEEDSDDALDQAYAQKYDLLALLGPRGRGVRAVGAMDEDNDDEDDDDDDDDDEDFGNSCLGPGCSPGRLRMQSPTEMSFVGSLGS